MKRVYVRRLGIRICNRRKGKLCSYHDRMKKQTIENEETTNDYFRENFTTKEVWV